MMKKLISAFLAVIMLMSLSAPASAYNYTFSSGADSGEVFGNSTSIDDPVTPDPMTENTRRNKDAAYFPPPYGIFSGYIPTDPSSPYHDNSTIYSGYSGNGSIIITDLPLFPEHGAAPVQLPGTGGLDYGGMLPPTPVNSPDITRTLPLYYEDGSIGTLSIPKLNLSIKVYSGETLENMRIGLGHFEFTSAWDGNVGLSGHNRGVPFAIGGVKDLKNGEKIIFTTKYGTRSYEVIHREQIADTDYSWLGWSDLNILTIITCVENVPGKRWCIVARETV